MTPYYRELMRRPSRSLREEERRLITKMLRGKPRENELMQRLCDAHVRDMLDGGMGSLWFSNDSSETRKFGKEIAEGSFLDADGVNAVFSFINQNSEVRVISAPRTVTLDNEPAMISVTRASPIINVTPSSGNVAGGSTITYTNLGVILNVTPRISANNYVNLTVVPEVSRVFDTITRIVCATSATPSV